MRGRYATVLRKELQKNRAPEVPDAPTHAKLVAAAYGDQAPRQAVPGANRGDNLVGASPYQDAVPTAGSAAGAPAGAAFGLGRKEA